MACDSPVDVASKVDIIFLMVPDMPDVERVLFGENGVAQSLRAGQIVVDMSSISPIATREFAAKVREKGADYLDAPVSGGEVGAGQVCKVANQVIVAATIEAVSEALLLASKAGVDAEKVRTALMGGFASSRILEVHGERMTKRTFNPDFRICIRRI